MSPMHMHTVLFNPPFFTLFKPWATKFSFSVRRRSG